MKARLRKIAEQIVEIEKKCQNGTKNLGENIAAIEKITANLSPEELFAIDEYITENNLLPK